MIQTSEALQRVLPVSSRDHSLGLPSAQVTLIQYGDYACAHSRQVYAVVKDNRERFGARFRFVFRHFPVNPMHSHAHQAAEAAEAAGAQGKFWEMHNTLFAHPQDLGSGFLVEYAALLRLDTTRFLREMAQHAYAERVREDYLGGIQSGVNGTPTVFINAVRQGNFGSAEMLLSAIEAATDLDEVGIERVTS